MKGREQSNDEAPKGGARRLTSVLCYSLGGRRLVLLSVGWLAALPGPVRAHGLVCKLLRTSDDALRRRAAVLLASVQRFAALRENAASSIVGYSVD
eukprot:3342068-Pleurochrysis_carterae.AAC.1